MNPPLPAKAGSITTSLLFNSSRKYSLNRNSQPRKQPAFNHAQDVFMSRDSRTGQSDLSSTSKRSTSVNGNLLEPIRSFLQLRWPGRCVVALPPRRVRDPALSQSQRRRAATVQSVIRHSSVPGPSCSDHRPSGRQFRGGVGGRAGLVVCSHAYSCVATATQRGRCFVASVSVRNQVAGSQPAFWCTFSSGSTCSSGNKCTFSCTFPPEKIVPPPATSVRFPPATRAVSLE